MLPYQVDNLKSGAVTLTLLHMNILFYFYFILIGMAFVTFIIEFLHYRFNWKNNGHWMPQNGMYVMKPSHHHQLSTESDISYQRKRLIDVLHDKVLHLQKRNSYDFNNQK